MLQYLEIGLTVAAGLVAIVATAGTATPAIAAAATAANAYLLGSTAYSVATGETLITGTKLSTEERLWAAADLVATGLSAGSTKILGLAEAGRLSTKAADIVEGSSSLLKVTKHADDVMDAINIGKDVVTGDVQSLVMDAGMVGLSAVVKARNNTTVKTGGDSVNSDYQNYVARKKANGESYLSEADWTQKVSTLSANTAAYSDFKASALESFKGTATDVESNITIETRNAAGDVQRVQVKAIGFDEAGNVRIQDYTTAANGLSVNRQSLLDDLSKYGGTVVGDGKGAFTGGTEIKPGTQIDVVSQKTDNLTIGSDSISNFRNEMEELPHIDLSQNVVDGLISPPNGKRPSVERIYSQEEIATHLAMFEDGIVKVQSYEDYQMSAKIYGGTIGAEQGHYAMPKWVYEKAVQVSNGDPRVLEELLGLDDGYLGNNPVVIDINHYEGLRMPSGNEPGAFQGLWEPGGYTKGGIPEAVIDQLGPNDYEVSKIFSREGV